MKSKKNALILAVFGVLFTSLPARAEDALTETRDTERGYAYTFDDDPLDATPESARGARITVRPIGKRTLLIRPRTHFIVELFKTAEDL